MKKFILLILALVFYAAQSNAADRWEADGQYIGFRYYGVQSAYTANFYGHNDNLGMTIPSAPIEYKDNGSMYSVISGIMFPNLMPGIITPRGEIELMYFPINNDSGNYPAGLTYKSNNFGLGWMLNLVVDIDATSRYWTPYFGIGAGAVGIFISETIEPAGYFSLIDTKFVGAFSATAGIAINITDYFYIDGGFKFMTIDDQKHKAAGYWGEGYKYEVKNFNMTAFYIGLGVKF